MQNGGGQSRRLDGAMTMTVIPELLPPNDDDEVDEGSLAAFPDHPDYGLDPRAIVTPDEVTNRDDIDSWELDPYLRDEDGNAVSEFCASFRQKVTCSSSTADIAMLELARVLDKARCPLYVYDEVARWVNFCLDNNYDFAKRQLIK